MKKIFCAIAALMLALASFAQNNGPSQYFLNAYKAYEEGNLELALQYIQKQCEEEECDFQTRYLTMLVCYKAGEYEVAGMLAQQLLPNLKKDAHEERSDLYVYMAVAAFEKNDQKGAIKLLNKALKEAPRSSWIFYERGYVYAHQKRFDAAIKDLQKSFYLDSTRIEALTLMGTCYQYKGNQQEMARCYEEAIRRTEGKQPYIWCEYSAAHFELGQIDQAIDKLFTAILINPNDARTGRMYNNIQRKNKPELLARLKQKAEEEPKSATWHSLLGDTYQEMDSLKQAYHHYRIASLLEPTYDGGVTPLKRLAQAYAEAEDYDAAIALLDEGLEASPMELVYHRLKQVYTHSKGQVANALTMVERLILFDEKQHDELLFISARYLYDLGRYEESMAKCLELMKTDFKTVPDYTLLMGKLYAHMGKTAESDDNFRILLKDAEKFYDYAAMKPIGITKENAEQLGPFSLPRALMGLGRTDQAQEVVTYMNKKINDVLLEHPDVQIKGSLLYNLACVNAQTGLLSEALDMLDLADRFGYSKAVYMQNDPDFEPLLQSGDSDILLRWQQICDRIAAANQAKAALIHEATDGVKL